MGFWDKLNAALGPKGVPIRTEIRVEDNESIAPTHAVGESHYQPALNRVSGRRGDEEVRYVCRATVRLEPENQAHPEALVVEIDGHRVGYISHDDATWWRPVMKEAHAIGAKFTFVAKVVARGPAAERETVNAGVMVWLPGPDELERLLEPKRRMECTVDQEAVSTRNAQPESQVRRESMRSDIKAAAKDMSFRTGTKRELKHLEQQLQPSERVTAIASGAYGNRRGILVLTSSRVLFLSHGLTGSTHEDFPLAAVNSIGYSGGVAMATVTIHAAGNSTKISSVPKKGGTRLVEAARQALADLQSTAAGPAASDPIEKLAKLAELRDSGALTEEEFAAQKALLPNPAGN